MRKLLILMVLSLACVSAWGQKADLRRGNRQFRKGQWDQADISYRKALMQDTSSVTARYNLANNLYRQQNFDEAAKQLEGAAQNAAAEPFAADFYFNQGDVAIARQDWQTAVQAFMQCLLLTPEDLKAKENYIYARNKLMEQQQNQQQNQDQNQNQDGQDQQQQQQDQDQDQNQDQQDQQQQQDGQDPPQEQPQQSQPQEQELSPQQAQQLLQAIQEKEKETQEKVDAQKVQALKSRQKDKNW